MKLFLSRALHDYYAQEREALTTESAIRADLLELGICLVNADYDGVGDSGQIENINYLDHAEPAKPVEVSEELNARVEAVLYALLNLRHGGWENNDGGFGSFNWNLADGTIDHEHHQRYTEHDTSTHEGFGIDPGHSHDPPDLPRTDLGQALGG